MRPSRAARGILLAALAIAVAAGGCGYTLQGNLPDHLKTVTVPVFKNQTTEPGAENTITAAVINAFTSNGRLKVVSFERADCILDGEVTGYQVQSLTYDSKLNLRSYRLTVTMNVRFRDLRKTELIWQQDALVENVTFDVAGQVSDTISREEGAVKQAALEIGRKIVNRAVDRF
jgi:outer membrane lipopolysaccharide assembly protein LptE/RlpB